MKKPFEVIFIMLGDACNFKCTYCMQGDHKLRIVQPELSKDFLSFLDKQNKEDNITICFWGGEPLIYFETIKKIVKRFGDKFKYETTSNCSLLTTEIMEFFNEYNMKLSISHDGSITKETRKTDVLQDEKIKEIFYLFKRKIVNVTYSSISPSLEDIFNSYPKEQMVSINTMINTTDSEISYEYANFSKEKYEKDIMYLLNSYEAYLNGDTSKLREYKNVDRYIHALDIYLKEGRQVKRCFDCGFGMKMLNIDCNGNVYLCHNSKIKIGTVNDSQEEIEKEIASRIEKVRKKCQHCTFNQVCGGSCILLSGRGEAQKCRIQKIFYSLFIPWAIKMAEKYKHSEINS